MQNQTKSYWQNIHNAVTTLWNGLKLTFLHFKNARKKTKITKISSEDYFINNNEGIATIQYPHEMIPIPDNGRYRLHNEIDDCIVCDKCAKVCPVDCIDIEPIKSTEVYGHTSDGTPKRIYAAKFDIDMAKCCFCGLCTVVCPTECLTMTKTFDFSEYDVQDHTYAFANMSQQETEEKKSVWEAFERNKNLTPSPKEDSNTVDKVKKNPSKPIFRPKIKPQKSQDDD